MPSHKTQFRAVSIMRLLCYIEFQNVLQLVKIKCKAVRDVYEIVATRMIIIQY